MTSGNLHEKLIDDSGRPTRKNNHLRPLGIIFYSSSSIELLVVHVRTFKKLFEKPKDTTYDAAEEVNIMEVEDRYVSTNLEVEPIYVRSMNLTGAIGLREIDEELKKGNILVIDISGLMTQDPTEVKQTVDQVKIIAQKIGGEIGKVSDTKIIATPKFIKIQFKKSD